MEIFLNYYTLSLFLGGIVAILSGVIVYFSDSSRPINRAWMLLNVSTAVWSFGYFLMISASDHGFALLADWVLHLGAIFIPFYYFLFILHLTDNAKYLKRFFYGLIPVVVFFVISTPTAFLVRDVFQKGPFSFAPDAGRLYPYFTVYFFGVVILSLLLLIQKIRSSGENRARLRYVLYSSLAGFTGGGFVFFLTFNIPIPPYPLVLFAFYPIIIAYAMLRHRLFDIRVFSTEFMTASIWILLLFRTVLEQNETEQIISGALLLLTIIFGIILVRSVYREIEQRERIEKLASELERANDRLKELDKLKSEFVSLATHQIRGPITAIKGYASMLLEGDYGEVAQNVKQPVETIFQSSSALAIIVQDFLDVSRIEQGRMKYEFTDFDLGALVTEVTRELRPNIEHKGLTLTLTADEGITVHADAGKLRQVIGNLIDNSLKYTPTGSINVTVTKEGANAFVRVSDTGVGIHPETLPKLFQKFSRAEDASKANILGTGLGLYVAKQLISAQGGSIEASSPGLGKGSTFTVTLPLKQ